MPNLHVVLACGALVAALAGCAANRPYEEPHHFSRDSRGNRIACYATEAANEYECVPVRRYAYADPYYDPYWSLGFYYGWPRYYGGNVIVVQPAPAPAPPPHFRPRNKGR